MTGMFCDFPLSRTFLSRFFSPSLIFILLTFSSSFSGVKPSPLIREHTTLFMLMVFSAYIRISKYFINVVFHHFFPFPTVFLRISPTDIVGNLKFVGKYKNFYCMIVQHHFAIHVGVVQKIFC